MKIEIISASPRQNSVTFRLALFLKKYLNQHSKHQFDIIDARDWSLPALQSVWNSVEEAPDAYKPLAKRMFEAGGFILLSPEYNGSYTPALKNIVDHFPKQSRKPMAIVTASPGALGGVRASQQMQLLIAALFGVLAPCMLVTPQVDKKFDAEGNLIDPSFLKAVEVFATEFEWLANALDKN